MRVPARFSGIGSLVLLRSWVARNNISVAALRRRHQLSFSTERRKNAPHYTRIPDPQGREVVFARRSGKRSVTASQAAQAAGLPDDAHLAGGILAWKATGHPTES
jgi:rhodanese-related sulfurtransferase